MNPSYNLHNVDMNSILVMLPYYPLVLTNKSVTTTQSKIRKWNTILGEELVSVDIAFIGGAGKGLDDL
jgi:hypothetical protein